MPRFFICYRRHDSAYAAHWLCDSLQAKFGKESVFIDVHSIPLGVDFREHIRKTVTDCDAVLAMIGDLWLDSCDDREARRLDDPRDFVRLEIAMALAGDIPVIPVLIGSARMPAEEQLPDDLKPLAYRQAAELRPGADYPAQLIRLLDGLRDFGPESAKEVPEPVRLQPLSKSTVYPTAMVRSTRITTVLAMVPIPAGTFAMGTSARDPSGYLEEQPDHAVTLTHAFEMSVTPVTQMLFEEVMHGQNPSRGRDLRRPADSVTWHEAIAFCNRLSELECVVPYYRVNEVGQVFRKGGTGFRLPTEAEWEFACRAGTAGARFCDEGELDRFAWFKDNSQQRTRRAGRKEPNPWGLRDVLGNVWEWCWDWYQENYYTESPVHDPAGPVNGREKVLRGGSFGDSASVLRCANRYQLAPHVRQDNVGFRVARTVEE